MDRLGFAAAEIVGVARMSAAPQAGQSTLPTADERKQQIRMRGVMAPGELAILSEFGLHLVKLLLTDQRWNEGHREPLGRSDRCGAPARSNRLQRRTTPTRRTAGDAPGVDVACIGRIGQDAAHTARLPTRFACGRRQTLGGEVFGYSPQAPTRLEIAGEDLTDDGGLGGLDPDGRRIAGVVQSQPIAVGRARPGQD
jgi:hypothetical protein